jgi:hypothetical protein
VRKQALDPRNFKDSGDLGTLAVRYVVQVQGFENTVLRIDAVFVEDIRHTVHPSNGSVESSEYKDIHERLDAVELMKKENAEALRAKQERLARKTSAWAATQLCSALHHRRRPKSRCGSGGKEYAHAGGGRATAQTLEQHVAELAPSGGADRQEARGSAQVRSVPHREHAEISGAW